MEPDSYSEASQNNYERYRELKEQLNEEMEKWTLYSEETENFIANCSLY